MLRYECQKSLSVDHDRKWFATYSAEEKLPVMQLHQRRYMRGRFSVSFSLVNETRRLVDVTKWIECKRVKITSGNAVVLAKAVRKIAMERTIIKVERLLKMVMSAPIVSHIPTGGAENAMSYKSL